MTRPAPKVSVRGRIQPCCPGDRDGDGGTQLSLTPCYAPAAFVSKRAGAEVVRRHKRNYVYDR